VKQVVLVGLMGSGKSTVGALVAPRTGREFVDVDVLIAEETGKTVRELWEEGGEAAYRQLESDAVLRVLRGPTPSVLAAPGGVILNPLVRTALADCTVVWLRTDPATLAGRVRPGDHRPLLGDRPAETLAAQAKARSDLYQEVATAVIDTDDLGPDAIADVVVGLLADGQADAASTD
jgi:shikimate kinase